MGKATKQKLLFDKIKELPPERLAEVEDFVDFLRLRADDSQMRRAALQLAETSFQRVWDNPEDADYDRL